MDVKKLARKVVPLVSIAKGGCSPPGAAPRSRGAPGVVSARP